MTARYLIGDTRKVLREMPDASVDLVMSSPPFLALRSYLPADHPDKGLEIGSESTPGEFMDVLLDVVEECARVLTPHGSLVFELGDTYAGSTNTGGDCTNIDRGRPDKYVRGVVPEPRRMTGNGWPLDKSKVLIPELFAIALSYGFNPLTRRTTEPWRVRNVIAWCLDGDTVVYARTPKGEGPTRLLHLTQNWQPGQWELWDGERWTSVLGWSASESDDAIEIEFRNGERVSATCEHEWPTTRGLICTENLRVGDVVDAVQLPEPSRPGWQPTALPDEEIGWLLGTFLADGSFDSRDRIQISGHVNEGALRHVRFERLAGAYDGTASVYEHGEGNQGSVVVRSSILAAVIRRYIGGEGARTKRLRAATWRRSNEFLRAILDGYLAGDGHYEAKNDRWRVGFTDNGWLARDLRVLCARLGVSCRIKRVSRKADPRGGSFAGTARFMYHGSIRLEPNPRAKADSEIVALRASKRRRFFDIGVEGEPHLFALGSGILTHNCRPNPPVGALGDKVRPATSYLTVACRARDRWYDLDAVRTEHTVPPETLSGNGYTKGRPQGVPGNESMPGNPAGAPPLDWWSIPTAPYKGAHYATYPAELCRRPILMMCPPFVCRTCGKPRRRIVGDATYTDAEGRDRTTDAQSWESSGANGNGGKNQGRTDGGTIRVAQALGWTDCGHDNYRRGITLDPFAGSGTTLMVAEGLGRDSIGIDLDPRNLDLARGRCGMFLEVEA